MLCATLEKEKIRKIKINDLIFVGVNREGMIQENNAARIKRYWLFKKSLKLQVQGSKLAMRRCCIC